MSIPIQVLENDYAKVSPMTMDHLDHLLPIVEAHPDLLRYSPSAFGNKEALTKYMETALLTRKPFVIFDKQKNSYAGSTSLGNISVPDARLEIGWTWIGEAFQGSGLNKAVKFLLLSYAFETLNYQRVEFKIDSRNTKSRAAVSKIGAVLEGELRSHTMMQDGFIRNTCFYSILQTEWLGLKNSIFKDFIQ